MTDSSFLGQYTNFTRPDQIINGTRVSGDSGGEPCFIRRWRCLTLRRLVRDAKAGLNVRNYALSGQAVGTPGSFSSTLPIVSVDSE